MQMEKKREEIESFSSILEKEGFSPVAARVYVYLLLSGDEGGEFDDLVQYFNVSKSAISNALNYLQLRKMIDYRTIGGQRKRNFFVDLDAACKDATSTLKLEKIASFYSEICHIRNKKDEYSKKLKNLSLLCKMFSAEIPIIIERWRNMVKEENDNQFT